jgi:hypothetical protein
LRGRNSGEFRARCKLISVRHSPVGAGEGRGEVPFGAKPKNSPALGNKEQDGTIYRST